MARIGIPTTYDGVNYRSRLEARWAAFFRQIGWRFTYEPFDADGYIPDFLIHGKSPLLVEVKPAVTEQDYRDAIPKIERALDGHWERDILIVGVTSTPALTAPGRREQYVKIGLLGEYYNHDVVIPGDKGWAWCPGIWTMKCGDCKQNAIWHSTQSTKNRPCGCGDQYAGNPYDSGLLTRLWKAAGNDVQWKARRTDQATTRATAAPVVERVSAVQPLTGTRIALGVGDRVAHDAFGSGTVLRIDGEGDRALAHVDFGVDDGVKRLLLRYAPVKRI